MAAACASRVLDKPLVEGLIGSVDCNVGNLVQASYGQLAAPDSQLVLWLTGLMTVYVAVIGLRMMLGLGTFSVGGLTMAAIKIGAILALATNWPLYHQLVFTSLYQGPEELAGRLLGGSGQSPVQLLHGQLQMAYDELQASSAYYAQRAPGVASPWVGGPAFSAAALNLSSIMMLVSTLGLILAVRVVLAAILLAGPLVMGFLLFETTRGIFLGWLRAAIGLALAPIFALLALVLELTLLQPHLVRLSEIRAAVGLDASPVAAVLVITLVTSSIAMLGLVASAVVGFSLRLPFTAPRQREAQAPGAVPAAAPLVATVMPAAQIEVPPRIAAVAAASAALDRRDSRLLTETRDRGGASALGQIGRPEAEAQGQVALGRSHRRSARPLAAASSLRRDG